MRKKIIKLPLLGALALLLVIAAAGITYGQTLYEVKTEQVISRGVKYEYSQRITFDGPLDVHVLTIDLTEEHLEIQPIVSQMEYGFKQPVSELVETNGAIAGVNGDFFGVAGEYSAPMGLEIVDGNITSASVASNGSAFQNATLFIDNDNTPFIDYVKTELMFYNNGVETFKLYAFNRVTDAVLPFYIDRNIYETTAELDARFPNLYKIMVVNNRITYISKAGETVYVPAFPDGYVIVMNESSGKNLLNKFAVGQSASVQVKANIDYENISAAISGGGKILTNGVLVSDGYYVTGRHPRTALGVSADGTKLIMMVVDGRGGSIGATHEEMASLLLGYGVYNAMHLDGGGSSAIAVMETDGVLVKNEPSDGKERNVVNGLGVFNNSTMSEIIELEIEAASDTVFMGAAVKLSVYGLDEYRNRIKLDDNFFSLRFSDEDGYYSRGYFFPRRTGEIWLTADFNSLSTAKMLDSMELAQINVNFESIKMEVGDEISLDIYGRSTEGHTAVLSGAAVEVLPRDIAYFNEGKIIGLNSGAGYIKVSVGSIVRYAKIIVGAREVLINPFEPASTPVSYLAFPESNPGHIVYTKDVVESGTTSLELAYKMGVSNETQAAYVVFDKPIQLPDEPASIKLSVFGDNSGNWLRAKIIDADGKSYAIDFAKNVDWTEFKTVEAKIPEDVKYPVSIERIYIANLENTYTELRKLYFNNLIAIYPIEARNEMMPTSTPFIDGRLAVLDNEPQEGEFEITISLLDFSWFPTYTASELSDGVTLINLTAYSGSLYSAYPWQWVMIKKALQEASDNIIVAIDKNPLVSIPKKEYALLHALLAETAKDKNVIVVSPDGMYTTLNTTDAVRYANLGSDSRKLRLRINEEGMRFSFQ